MSNPTQPIDFEKARRTAETVLNFDRAYPGERDPVKTILATALLSLLAPRPEAVKAAKSLARRNVFPMEVRCTICELSTYRVFAITSGDGPIKGTEEEAAAYIADAINGGRIMAEFILLAELSAAGEDQ